MNKILQFIFNILKILSWLWIGCWLIVLFTAKTVTGIPLIYTGFWVIVCRLPMIPAVAFLIWIFKTEKEIRNQRKISKKIDQQRKIKEENFSKNSIQTLVEFKELLSLGIITKEEFEKKKMTY